TTCLTCCINSGVHSNFTAKYMVDNAPRGALRSLVEEHFFDDKWREVFIMAAGMLDQADDFLFAIIEKLDTIALSRLEPLLKPVRATVDQREAIFKQFGIPLELARTLCLGRILEEITNHKAVTNNSLLIDFDLRLVLKRTFDVTRALTSLYSGDFV